VQNSGFAGARTFFVSSNDSWDAVLQTGFAQIDIQLLMLM